MSKIIVFGIMVADMVANLQAFPKAGETILGDTLHVYMGGKGMNQCVAIKRLGGDSEMIGCLGNDGYGDMFRKLLKEEKIPHQHVLTSSKIPTGIAQIQIDSSGQNKIVVIPAANHEFKIENLQSMQSVFDDAEYAVFQLEMRFDVTFKAMQLAHEKGIKIIFNPAPAMKLPNDMIKLADYITPNEVELGIIADEDTTTMEGIEKAAKKLLALGAKNIIATLGSKGALIATKDYFKIIPGYVVDNVVDTVAAGDSFNGALVTKLAEGASLEEAVLFANAMGALTVQVKGAIPSLHTRLEVETFIKNN